MEGVSKPHTKLGTCTRKCARISNDFSNGTQLAIELDMIPDVEIAKTIADPELILLYIVIVGLLGKIFLDSQTIKSLIQGIAKIGESTDNISKLLYAIVSRGKDAGP